ncbi:hypothetical protein ACIQUM_37510 [Amycolatopsis azurea]|uniref:hypothetical protein n=1 Tax=Amycolatopsis azurea TaxID=36819 RepID=UPI0037FC588E
MASTDAKHGCIHKGREGLRQARQIVKKGRLKDAIRRTVARENLTLGIEAAEVLHARIRSDFRVSIDWVSAGAGLGRLVRGRRPELTDSELITMAVA